MAAAPASDRHRGLRPSEPQREPPFSRAARFGLYLFGGLSLLACPDRGRDPDLSSSEHGPADPVHASPPPTAPPIAIYGCRALFSLEQDNPASGGSGASVRCVRSKPRPISLWVEGGELELELDLDGEAIEHRVTRGPAGTLIRVELGLEPGRLSLRGGGSSSAPGWGWSVVLAPRSQAYTDVYTEAVGLARAGESEAAHGVLTRAMDTVGADEASLLRCVDARVAYSAGELDRVLAAPAQIEAAQELADGLADGADGGAARAISCLAAAHMQAADVRLNLRPDFDEAERHLEAARRYEGVDLETQIGTRYLQGVLEHRLGHIDESLLSFAASAELARRVGAAKPQAAAMVMQAVALARLGRFEDARAVELELQDQLDSLSNAEQLVLEIRSNVSWIGVLRREEDPSAPDPSAAIADLVAGFERLDDPKSAARAGLNLALARLQSGMLDQAQRALTAVDQAQLDPHDLVWVELVGARLALARAQPKRAQARLDRAQRYTELTRDPEHRRRLWTVRAQHERARGNPDAALVAYAQASELADALALAVPGARGRSALATAHSRNDAAHVDLLLEVGDPEGALCVAASSRARHMRALWARERPALPPEDQRRYRALLAEHQVSREHTADQLRDAWELSDAALDRLHAKLELEGEHADALLAEATALLERRAPQWSCGAIMPQRAGEAVLAMIENGGTGGTGEKGESEVILLLAIAGRDQIAVGRAPLPSGPQKTAQEGAAQDDSARAFERALEPLRPVLEQVEVLRAIPSGRFMSVDIHRVLPGRVVYYSLGLGTGASMVRPAGRRAAVVAGARDLAGVTAEVELTGARLGALGWVVTATWSPIVERQPALLHYSGHGHRSGVDGWRSALDLPGVGTVGASEIIAAQRSPAWVVLAACSAAQVDPRAVDGGMNLASAFLLAGAELVIAPTVDVDDEAALALSRGLYAGEGSSLDRDALGLALAQIQRRQSAELEAGEVLPPARDYSSWRAWTP